MTALRILIADDNDAVRRGVIRLLSPQTEWQICGEAKNGPEAIEKARELTPDVILLDVSMPGMNGLEAARVLRKDSPSVKILVISQNDPTLLLPQVLAAGGDGCVDKGRLGSDLVGSIQSIKAS
jgi:DNA-binding NarL/FixJ family response regulator